MYQNKYVELLLKICLKIEETSSLFISYNKINKDFAIKLENYAKEVGISDVYLDETDSYEIHDILNNIKLEDIEKEEKFNCKIWDEYAKKDAAFLMLDALIPNLMDDIDSEKLAKMAYVKRNTKPIYREKQLNGELAWCIAAVPNELWAKEVFADSFTPLEDFWKVLTKICMLDKDDPIKAWDELLREQKEKIEKLNNLKIKKLHYKNNLGTDLTLELSNKALWQSASSSKWIVNMPSYEIFTTPDFRKTNGIVYSSMPLIYAGKVINEFSITFKNGKVEEYSAKEGEDVLKEIINSDKLSAYLGEVALVNYDSPIANTNKIFKSTLFDENASCHLALGSGFLECIQNGEELSKSELKDLGVNDSKNHVDFMIGTKDLTIEAETKNGLITIMKDGNLTI